jgi:hypothetical protein
MAERFVVPGLPMNGIVFVLEQVRGGGFDQSISHRYGRLMIVPFSWDNFPPKKKS